MRDEGGHHRRHHTISPPSGDQTRPSTERLITVITRGVAAYMTPLPSENVARQAPPPPPVPLPVVAPATAPLPQTSHRMAGGSIAPAIIAIAAESLATPLAVAGAIAMAGARTLTFPRKLRHAFKHREYVVLADLLSEHLTLSGCSSNPSRVWTRGWKRGVSLRVHSSRINPS